MIESKRAGCTARCRVACWNRAQDQSGLRRRVPCLNLRNHCAAACRKGKRSALVDHQSKNREHRELAEALGRGGRAAGELPMLLHCLIWLRSRPPRQHPRAAAASLATLQPVLPLCSSPLLGVCRDPPLVRRDNCANLVRACAGCCACRGHRAAPGRQGRHSHRSIPALSSK